MNKVGLLPARWRAAYTLKRVFYVRSKVDGARIHCYASQLGLPGAHRALVECARQIVQADVDLLVSQLKTIKVQTLTQPGEGQLVSFQEGLLRGVRKGTVAHTLTGNHGLPRISCGCY